MPLIFAQALGEYGGLSSLWSGIQQLSYSVSTRLESLSATTWAVIALVVVGLLYMTRR